MCASLFFAFFSFFSILFSFFFTFTNYIGNWLHETVFFWYGFTRIWASFYTLYYSMSALSPCLGIRVNRKGKIEKKKMAHLHCCIGIFQLWVIVISNNSKYVLCPVEVVASDSSIDQIFAANSTYTLDVLQLVIISIVGQKRV